MQHHLLLCGLTLLLFAAPNSAQDASAAPVPVSDQGWPRAFMNPDQSQTVTVYQPQVESWKDFDSIVFRAAVSVGPTGEDESTYGVLRMSADTEVAYEQRQVLMTNRKVESLTFTGVDAEQSVALQEIVMAAMPPERPQTIALDRLVAGMQPAEVDARTVDVSTAPPHIQYSAQPAIMVQFMGKPRFKPAPGGPLMFAINTNWDLFLDPATTTYYLLDEGSWLSTGDLDAGPWVAATPPAALSSLPDTEDWADTRAALPGTPATSIPAVFVVNEPSVLLVTDGGPELETVPGTKLMLVTNTSSQLLYEGTNSQYYLLAAGRWFAAAQLAGPWSAASSSLPADFKAIPADSDAGDVLAAVPGTPEANEAVVLASIPDKATIDRSSVTVDVVYDGTPVYKVIPGTTIESARNTSFDVFLVDGSYYCCHSAVWFVAPTATGPWAVADSVPAVIYSIPPTWPQYNVTYVRVYDSTPTTVVTGYTAGYTGAQVAATGVVMFGLGLALANAWDDDDDDCCWQYACNPTYFSYGCGAYYSNHYGGYVCSQRAYGPYGGAGRYAAYNPSTGRYSRGAFAYGPNGASGFRAAYNPSTGVSGYRAGATTPYGSWSRGAVSNGDEWARGGRASNARGSVGAIQGSEGGGAIHAQNRWGNGATVARNQDGDLYAGKDGNVYKKTDNGWEQANNNNRPNTRTTSAGGLGQGQGVSPRPTQGTGGLGSGGGLGSDGRLGSGGGLGSSGGLGSGGGLDSGGRLGGGSFTPTQLPSQAGNLQGDFQSRFRGNQNASRFSSFQDAGGRSGGFGGGGGGFDRGGFGGRRGGGGRRR